MFDIVRRQALPLAFACAISAAALSAGIHPAHSQEAVKPVAPAPAPAPSTAPAAAAPPAADLPEVKVIQKEPEPVKDAEQKPVPVPKKIVVDQAAAPPVPKKIKAAVPKSKPAAPKPVVVKAAPPAIQTSSSAPAPVDAEDFAQNHGNGEKPSLNPLANPGTPQANVAPVAGLSGSPGAQTATGIDIDKQRENDPVFSVNDILKDSPGVSLKQGNGPRDMGVSIRGSNARNGFGVRNIVVLEDGFPVTQPDGLSRTDLTDPHAYAGADVWRGPSSALFGNYATGGAINFRTRTGGELSGGIVGSDVGSFDYLNEYLAVGGKSGNVEAALFASDVRGDGYFEYGAFNTQTINALMSLRVSEQDTLTLKVINNNLHTELPYRTSLNQFYQNPFQEGCLTAATAALGCQRQTYSATGNPNSGGVSQTAAQAGAARDDRRTIVGARWEHKVDADSAWRLQYVADDRNIRQPTSTTGGKGDFFSHNVIGDYSQRTSIAGLPATYMVSFFWNYLPVDSKTYNIVPGGGAVHGLLQAESKGSTMNFGARAREEVKLSQDWTAVAGIGVERTNLEGSNIAYRYNTAGVQTSRTSVSADRTMTNVAPEAGLLYRPNDAWQLRGRVAAAYGTPQFSNLFVTPTGASGNNTELESQRNVGFDIGADWTPVRGISLSVTGFYEFFKDELVSQATAPGSANASFTYNVPASEHRGVEASVDVKITDGWRLTGVYLYNNQIYTDYSEVLTRAAGGGNPARTITLDRAGNRIPGIAENEITARLAYDVPAGPLKGLGAFVEYVWSDGFFMDNSNLLKVPSAETVNLNVHYNTEFVSGWAKSFGVFFEVRNVLDETNIGGANNIGNSLDVAGNQIPASVLANTSGAIYAASPRTFYGGAKIKF